MLPVRDHGFAGILFDEIELRITSCGRPRAGNLSSVAIDPDNRRPEIPLSQIETQQADSAADIDHFVSGMLQKFKSRRKNRIAPQFPPRIGPEPKLAEPRRDSGAGALVIAPRGADPVFHCDPLSR